MAIEPTDEDALCCMSLSLLFLFKQTTAYELVMWEFRRVLFRSLHILWLICLATVPAVIVGGLFEHWLRSVFGSASSAALFLFLNVVLLLVVEKLRNRVVRKDVRYLASLT